MNTQYIEIHFYIPVPTGLPNLIIGFAAYLVSLFIICRVLKAFRLQNAADRVLFTYGIPFLAVWWVISRPFAGWMWLQRNKRREQFKEAFDMYPVENGDYTAISIDQRTIDSVLRYRAEMFKSACDNQENARKGGSLKARMDADAWVSRAKGDFWQAHGLAAAYGYTVKVGWQQYIEPSQPPRSPSRRRALDIQI